LKSETNAAVDCVFGFTGRLFDELTHQQYNTTRWYDPKVGRWESEDWIGFLGGQSNLTIYCGNNPISIIDPNGTDTYLIFDVQGFTLNGVDYGHVGIITYNPKTKVYTSFDHSHGTVLQQSSTTWTISSETSPTWQGIGWKGTDIVIVIKDQGKWDALIDAARVAYKPKPGGSEYGNNCITSVLDILTAAGYKCPKYPGVVRSPNNLLLGFWDSTEPSYGIGYANQTAWKWIRKNRPVTEPPTQLVYPPL